MTELYPRRGRYRSGEPIELSLRGDENVGEVTIEVFHLAEHVATYSYARNETIALPALPAGGYGVRARLMRGDELAEEVFTAIDVDGTAVRYGFLCDFLPEDDADVESMAKYHMTHVQFYDWSYRHDTLVSPCEEYSDMMGKRNSLPVIRQKITACHRRGMLAMAYGAVYAASREFWERHRDWGLYAAGQNPMVFIDTFYYMDVSGPWRKHLMEQYQDALLRVGFDGVHMDAYGEPKRALSANGEPRELEADLPALIADTAQEIRNTGREPHLIFNNVGTWPVEATCLRPQEAIYMELWPPMDQYRHLHAAVQSARRGGKPIVLAAYPTPFRTDTPQRSLYSELILSFAIALQGATQLFLGEENAVVTQGYYADYSRLTPWQMERIKAYQDFFVRYQELLTDASLRDVSLTHAGGDNCEYGCDIPFTLEGEPERLWLTLREKGERKLIGLINLCGNREDCWNKGKDKPQALMGFTLRVLTLRPPKKVWYATPDKNGGMATELPFRCVAGGYGVDVYVTIPRLEISGMIWISPPY